MDFPTAVRTCLVKYADFSGRARRSEYWWFYLFSFVAPAVARVLDLVLGTDFDGTDSGLLELVVSLGLVVPLLAAGARRLHDIDRSGWWQLLWLLPVIGWVVVIVWLAKDGERGANKHGTSPKYQHAPSDYPPPPAAPYGGAPYGS